MFTVEHHNGALTLQSNEKPLLTGITPHLTLEDGSVLTPPYRDGTAETGEDSSGSYTVFRAVYGEDERDYTLVLELKLHDAVLVASAALRRGEKGIGRPPRKLAAYGALKLTVAALDGLEALMANYRHKDWWTRPYFDTDLTQLPKRTQSLVWKTGASYVHLLPVCGDVFRTDLQGGSEGLEIVTAACAAGYGDFETGTFALGCGPDTLALPEMTAAAGMQALGKPEQLRIHKRFPEPLAFLGWCSWDAFYHEITAEKVLAKAKEFNEKGVPVRWAILDDGWLHDSPPDKPAQHDRALSSFAPHPSKFPKGLAPLIQALKSSYGMEWVGVWHTLFGYWYGIHPKGAIAQTMRPSLYQNRAGMLLPALEAEKAFLFWNGWHSALRAQGVDFVKVDYQSGLEEHLAYEVPIGTAAKQAHLALEASVGRNFDGAVINCMGMATENIWHRTSAMTRNSDDFFPKIPGSFKEHALQNAYNAYFHAPFMALDWDMWWSKHPDALNNAVLRAISGGPIYTSDPLGATDATLLWPLALSDGRLLLCDQPAQPTADCLMRNPNTTPIPLKLWNRVGDTGVVAAFNVLLESGSVTGSLSPQEIPGLEGERFIVFEHFSRRARVMERAEHLEIVLPDNGLALYAVVPLAATHTPIGLVDKFIAAAGIADWTSTDGKTSVVLLEGGTFAWASTSAPTQVMINGEAVEPAAGDGVYTVDCSADEGSVWIEIA